MLFNRIYIPLFPLKMYFQKTARVPSTPLKKIIAKNGYCAPCFPLKNCRFAPSFRFLERGGAKQSDRRRWGQEKLG